MENMKLRCHFSTIFESLWQFWVAIAVILLNQIDEVIDLVREIRLTKAAGLIETTDSSITEIAYSVGFRDAGYFGKCFRKKYGKTPKEYRNDMRNEK